MISKPDALRILLDEQPLIAPNVPPDLIRKIYHIEERVQFDRDRREAAPRIRDLIQALLDSQEIGGP